MAAEEIRYYVSRRIFRQASLYAMFVRNRTVFRVGILTVLGAALYGLMAAGGLFPSTALPLFIGTAYLIGMLFLLLREERRILRCFKSPEAPFGVEHVLRFDDRRFTLDIPGREAHVSFAPSDLAAAFELSGVFMLYLSARQVCLVPTQAMEQAQRQALRHILREQLKARFFSRQKD